MSIQKSNINFRSNKPTNHKFRDLTGQVFNRLTVMRFAGITKSHKHSVWLCLCVCGKNSYTTSYNLTINRATSCGCRKFEIAKEFLTTHGEASKIEQSAEYQTYLNAKNRCQNPRNRTYSRYGGRGIEFRFNSFPDFLEEIGRKPSPKHSIERMDNNGHYEKGNVKWATRIEQANNKRNSRFVTVENQTDTISNWARLYGIGKKTIAKRLLKNWCPSCAVKNPLTVKCKHK